MKEHIITTWCDACLGEDGEGREEAETHIVAVDGKRTEVDLCDRHVKQLLAPLAALITERGVPSDPVQRATQRSRESHNRTPVRKEGQCPLCGAPVITTSLVNHIWNVHAGGRPDPLTQCPECGKRFDEGRALGVHRRSAHGYEALQAALDAAEARRKMLEGRR